MNLPRTDIIIYLETDNALTVQDSSVRFRQRGYLLGLYESGLQEVETIGASKIERRNQRRSRLQWNTSPFASQALAQVKAAKHILSNMVHHPSTPTWRVLRLQSSRRDLIRGVPATKRSIDGKARPQRNSQAAERTSRNGRFVVQRSRIPQYHYNDTDA